MSSLRALIRFGSLAIILIACCASALPDTRPRLVIVISIDQFRADYLTRFDDLFLPARSDGGRVGGFRYLAERGAYYVNAHHDHLPLATGPGHAVQLTGAPPYKTGIVGNDWWDYQRGRSVYCVQDDGSPLVGTSAKAPGISPDHLRVTTVGDELKMATGGHARVFGLALKDRAAVLMAGHLADGVFWYDDTTGRWISSRYFRKDGTLPPWLDAVNNRRIPAAKSAAQWDLSVPATAMARVWTPTGKYADGRAMGAEFPHRLPSSTDASFFRAYAATPFANDFVLGTAMELVRAEQLGRHDSPDLLAINLSSNDYIGHAFGPDSAEVLDVTVRTDRQLATFFQQLDSTVPGGLGAVDIVLTADHGAAPIGAAVRDAGMRGGNWPEQAATGAAQRALEKELGAGHWVNAYIEPYLWLDRAALAAKHITLERAEQIAAGAVESVEGVYAAYTRADALAGRVPRTDIGERVERSFHPALSGDVLIVSQPGYMPRGTALGTSHSEPYTYDTRVPLVVAGSGVRPGVYTERVSTLDIAPTLAFLLHLQQPSGCEGRLLTRALAADGPKAR